MSVEYSLNMCGFKIEDVKTCKTCYKKWSLVNCGEDTQGGHYRKTTAGTQKMIVGMKVINFKTDVPAWSPTAVYVPGELVQFEQNIYRCTHKTKQRPLQTVNGIITWKRVYDDFEFSSTYNKGDIVEYLGSIYTSLNDNNTANTDNRLEWIKVHCTNFKKKNERIDN